MSDLHAWRDRIKSEQATAQNPRGIHPRVWLMGHHKKNTALKKDKDVTRRKIAALEAHIERTGDKTPHSYISKLQATL